MRRSTFCLMVCWFLAGCPDQKFVFLTRAGNGDTGSIAESEIYYKTMDFPPEGTLTEWFASRCFNPATDLTANYYQDGDLGLGREMRCAVCGPTSPRPGLVSCAVSNHGVPQGLDLVQFKRSREDSIRDAFKALEDFLAGRNKLRGATVTMDFLASRPDQVRFYIYDASDPALLSPGSKGPETLIPGLQLDGEGGEFNKGVKFMRNCLNCHGGRYDAEKNQIFGATFLDFVVPLLKFSDDSKVGVSTANKAKKDANLDSLRRLNLLVRDVAIATKTPAIVDRINGSYTEDINLSSSQYRYDYSPTGWPADRVVRQFNGQDITAKKFYVDVVSKHCATCHFSQSPGNNLTQNDPSKPLTFTTLEQWFANSNNKADPDGLKLIRQDVCGSNEMPHAEVTYYNLRIDPIAFALICN